MALSKEQFEALRAQPTNVTGVPVVASVSAVEDAGKYAGKTETQINYLKVMEEADRKE